MLLSASYALLGGVVSADRYVAFFVVSGSFLAAGLVAWQRRPANRTGKLLVAIGLCVALAPIRGLPWPALTPIGIISASASHALLGYLLLAFPSGELRSTWSRALVALTAGLLVVPRLVSLAAFDPSAIGLDYVNPYLVIRDASVAAGSVAVAALIEILVVVGYVGALAVRWWRGSEPARRVLSPVLVPALMVAIIRTAEAVSRVGGPAGLQGVLFTAQFLAHAAIPLGFLFGLLRTRMARSLVADLVVELGETPAPARLRDALAHALGDRALTVAYWSPASGAFVDADGGPVYLPADGSARAVTRLERDGTPLAAIIHDSALLDDPGLVASVASAMRLAVENERLQAQVEEQLDEVRASRVRIVEAGDAERKRVERDLHDGAQQRLVSLTLALRLVRTKLGQNPAPGVSDSLDQATDDARAALAELRELARGIHPAILSQAGLGAAIESLADRSPVDVRVEVAADERFSPAVEATAYFVVSEALANIAKYAGATQATVRAARDGERLTVEVADNGVGGADASRGSGLRGLADRLSAIDGSMELDSPVGMGTRLLARIPIGPAAKVAG
jgi:signal transduction histidine kinase